MEASHQAIGNIPNRPSGSMLFTPRIGCGRCVAPSLFVSSPDALPNESAGSFRVSRRTVDRLYKQSREGDVSYCAARCIATADRRKLTHRSNN